ncbi:TetR/AcrR family transcriptional regulator [Paraburkholderia caribensis]|uniref:TetR/AcrR family transcriptional regulator n=1 Tax=Paraburkholderia caribensis TaxID=75105 RepID=UPI0034D1E5D9
MRREETRRRLFHSGRNAFARDGFAATSVETIAAEAGYTRGGFYSNFTGKSQFLLELLQLDFCAARDGLTIVFDVQQAAENPIFACSRSQDDQQLILWIEAKLLAARDPHFCDQFNAVLHERLTRFTDRFRQYIISVDTYSPLAPDTLAIGFMGIFYGMNLARLANPEGMTSRKIEDVLRSFTDLVLPKTILSRDR